MRQRAIRPGRKYASIPNDAMRDRRLSAEARGTLAYLMTHADDWQIIRSVVMRDMNVGRDQFQRIMGELRAAGYVELKVDRNENGGLEGSTWIIRDDPSESPDSLKTRPPAEGLKTRQPVNPTAGKPGPLRRPTRKKTNTKEDKPPFTEFFRAEAESKEPDQFEAFRQAYPVSRHGSDTAEAREEFRKCSYGTHPALIAAAAKRYAASNPDPQYVPKPENWLKGSGWQKYPEVEAPRHRRVDPPFWMEVVR